MLQSPEFDLDQFAQMLLAVPPPEEVEVLDRAMRRLSAELT